ncbi:MAG TPA: B12-binding domain-containing radical SAM protein [Syntrophobacteraceae bacterium]|nr:B12-binding domain-containing radical SAM protein [Syntrophobacteraceae bacterium]
MKILLVYPKVEETFWSFKHALKIVRRKAAFPPLGALTVAAMLPASWEKRLVDMNVRDLLDADIQWADLVFISAMVAQKDSARRVIDRCRQQGTTTVGGGPLFNTYRDDYADVDHLVLGEAETNLAPFLTDLLAGRPQRIYASTDRPDLSQTPLPLWDLIRLRDYSAMSIQYSRGCPFNCEFCDIIIMNGRVPRTKSSEQILAELDALYNGGWRGSVFIVDDNFIGNKARVKKLLRAIIGWQRLRETPFTFFTEASVDLAEDEELMTLMAAAGFNKVFLGLETPSEASLKECGKTQNLRRSLQDSVHTIQGHGMAVMGGFIIGFDNDPPDIFQRQVDFVQKSGVVTAMIGLLTAIPGTRLYKRLEQEGRLLFKPSGNNTDVSGSLNFIPKMDRQTIVNGYQWVMSTIYSPEMFYRRILAFLRQYQPQVPGVREHNDVFTFLRSLWYLGLVDQKDGRGVYRLLLREAVSKYRQAAADVVTLAIYGYHFRRLFWSPQIPMKWEDWWVQQSKPQEG